MERTELESIVADEKASEALRVVLARADEAGTVEWADVRAEVTDEQWGRLIGSTILIDAGYANGFVLDDPEAVRESLARTDSIGESPTPAGRPGSTGESDGTDIEASGESEYEERGTDAETGTEPDSDIETDAESETEPESESEGIEATKWTRYDKTAAVAALGLMAFEISGSRAAIGRTMNAVYGPLESVLPFYAIVIVLAVLLGVYSTLLQSWLADYELAGRHRARMNDIQERRKAAKERGDDEAIERIQEEQMEAMGGQTELMKAQFRPMVWIVLLTIPAYLWLYWMVQGHVPAGETAVILPFLGRVSWTAAVLGPIQAWLVWYFLCSIASRQVLRKAFGIQTNPTPSGTDA